MAFNFNFNLVVMLIAMAFTSMHFPGTAAQTTHVVGDALGWTIPSGDLAAYTTWASRQTFTVGDILVFNFNNGEHDVAEVSAAAYGPCNATSPITLTTTGPATITLTTAGSRYYICTFTSHCQIGQKLSINVSTAGNPTTPPSTTPAPPPAATAVPPMTRPTPPATPDVPCPPTSSPDSSPLSPPTINSGNTAPPPPSSGAPISGVVGPISTFLAVVIVLLNY
ncbi:hypothetical protein L6452_26634 [Arctium lappa]|uniref:Uncharacterized protein n=1 Tax=Arctium lappa TaxID=4217 RepID=A0ACB8ZU42_ARCLA|nr:hypothetical protein L6452_26634 [Arctium lappa]